MSTARETQSGCRRTYVLSATYSAAGGLSVRSTTRLGERGEEWSRLVVRQRRTGVWPTSPSSPQFAHERADSLSLDRSRAVAAQLCADAARAVGWPLPSDSLAMRPHLLLLRVCGGHPAEPLVRIDAPAWQVKPGADHCQRIRRGAAPPGGAPRAPRRPPGPPTARFSASSSSVKRPTSRSNSATRCSACWLRSSPANTLAACVTKSAFHRLSRSGLS